MELAAFASFAVLVVAWAVLPSRRRDTVAVAEVAAERVAA